MDQGDFNDVAKKALAFRNQYYKLLDEPEQRGELLALYASDVPLICEWNGHALSNVDMLREYFGGLPKTKHHIDMVDAQPLPGNEGGDSFLMTVHGVVTYNDEHKREFYQRFVIRRANNSYYIMNDYYRWLSERS